ncbi:hypothetical protein HYU14_02535 [Candidatus Woesearchaeota archaeon]|nr:hypothetical protein [Candidatus Woesearchaeota archaeon]
MPHNMTVTIEDDLWEEMKKNNQVRWSAVMRDGAREKLKALKAFDELVHKNKLSDEEIREFAVSLGKKVTGRK